EAHEDDEDDERDADPHLAPIQAVAGQVDAGQQGERPRGGDAHARHAALRAVRARVAAHDEQGVGEPDAEGGDDGHDVDREDDVVEDDGYGHASAHPTAPDPSPVQPTVAEAYAGDSHAPHAARQHPGPSP